MGERILHVRANSALILTTPMSSKPNTLPAPRSPVRYGWREMLQRVNADAARPSWSWLPRARTPAEMANDRPVVWVEDVVHDVSHFRTEDSLRLLRLVAALTHIGTCSVMISGVLFTTWLVVALIGVL